MHKTGHHSVSRKGMTGGHRSRARARLCVIFQQPSSDGSDLPGRVPRAPPRVFLPCMVRHFGGPRLDALQSTETWRRLAGGRQGQRQGDPRRPRPHEGATAHRNGKETLLHTCRMLNGIYHSFRRNSSIQPYEIKLFGVLKGCDSVH